MLYFNVRVASQVGHVKAKTRSQASGVRLIVMRFTCAGHTGGQQSSMLLLHYQNSVSRCVDVWANNDTNRASMELMESMEA